MIDEIIKFYENKVSLENQADPADPLMHQTYLLFLLLIDLVKKNNFKTSILDIIRSVQYRLNQRQR